jgi:putative transposase
VSDLPLDDGTLALQCSTPPQAHQVQGDDDRGQREAERSYGVTEELLTPAVSWSAWRLRKDFNAVKHQVAPWWPENSKEAYASGLANLAAALANWAASRAGTRRGPKIAFPKVG